MLVAMFAAQFKNYRYLGIVLPFGILAVVHVYEDFRIMAVICFLVPVYSVFLMSAKKEKFGRMRLVILFMTVAGARGGFALIFALRETRDIWQICAAENRSAKRGRRNALGWPQRNSRVKRSYSGLPISGPRFLGTRSKIRRHPCQRSAALGYKPFQGGKRDDLIPTDSYVFGSWVEAGIVGGIFWIFMLGITVYAVSNATGTEPLLPLFAFAGLMLTWDTLFSPLGMPTRFVAPFFMAAMILLRRFQTEPLEYGWENRECHAFPS